MSLPTPPSYPPSLFLFCLFFFFFLLRQRKRKRKEKKSFGRFFVPLCPIPKPGVSSEVGPEPGAHHSLPIATLGKRKRATHSTTRPPLPAHPGVVVPYRGATHQLCASSSRFCTTHRDFHGPLGRPNPASWRDRRGWPISNLSTSTIPSPIIPTQAPRSRDKRHHQHRHRRRRQLLPPPSPNAWGTDRRWTRNRPSPAWSTIESRSSRRTRIFTSATTETSTTSRAPSCGTRSGRTLSGRSTPRRPATRRTASRAKSYTATPATRP